jgi:hypothetical protein
MRAVRYELRAAQGLVQAARTRSQPDHCGKRTTVWVNFWYRDAAQVKEPVEQMFQTGSVSFMIQPGQDTILGPFNCPLGAVLGFPDRAVCAEFSSDFVLEAEA